MKCQKPSVPSLIVCVATLTLVSTAVKAQSAQSACTDLAAELVQQLRTQSELGRVAVFPALVIAGRNAMRQGERRITRLGELLGSSGE